jgi:hypothetical protein
VAATVPSPHPAAKAGGFVNFAGQAVRWVPVPGKPYAYTVTFDGEPVDFMAQCVRIMELSKK